jgi:Carboxypeptidase regulatory-like domain/TonB dependent receptor
MILPTDFRKIAISFLAFGALGLSLLISAPVWAQVAGATLSGTVTDTSAAIIPQAKISIKNVATGISTTVTANADGFYTAPNLLPGSYEITASAPGFATDVHSGITLTVGAQQALNFTLQVGQVTQKVEVTGEAPAVQLASSSISAVVNSNTIVDLPLNGRDWTQLAALQPGVNIVLVQSNVFGRVNRGFGGQEAISGTRPQLNNYRLDGISIVDYSGGSPGSVLGVALGVDAIAEFSVLTSNYSAEYGRTSGGVVNAITRSGTNQIHGDAYWFLRDEALDARQFFDSTLPPFHRNQFGVSAGGPIQKDKTFFFTDYEGFRQGIGLTNVDNVPSQDARNGILHNADGTTTTVAVNPLVKAFLPLYPLPNAGLIGTGDTGLFDVAGNDIIRENFETVRIDRKFSEKDSIFGTWYYDKGLEDTPDPLNNSLFGNTSLRQMIALEETHIFSPSLVNSLRGGFNRVVMHGAETLKALNPLVTDASLGSFPGLFAPQVSVPGLTDFAGGGVGAYTGDVEVWNSFQAYDDAFLTRGVHSLKFGFAFERLQQNVLAPRAPNGQFNFGSLADFLTNRPLNFQGQVPGVSSPRGVRQSLLGGYLQDDWLLRPNLTLNLGLRYEMVTVPTEVQGKLSNLLTFTSPTPHLGSPYFKNPTLRNFEPRVGFSWDPFHNGKTAVRGAFGIFDALPLNYEFFITEVQSAPFVQILTGTSLPAGSFPTGAAAASGIVPLSTLLVASIQPTPPRNYVMIWNLNVQRQLTPSAAVTVSYVGNHGVHMENRADDVNDVVPTATSQGLLWPSPSGSGTRLNPNVGQVRGIYWDGDSQYHALEVEVSKRMSHGFQAQGSYTWGKNIDTGSSSVIGDAFSNSLSSLFWFCRTCRRSLSDFNIAQTLTVNYNWDVPTPKNWGAIGSHVLGGWELGAIITAETGVPITPIIGGDPLGLNNTDPFAFPNRLSTPGCTNPVNPGNPNNYIKLNCFAVPMAIPSFAAVCTPFSAVPGSCSNLMGNAGRNTIVGPGIVNFDFSLFKNNYIKRISESFNAQFRAEFFNILNRADFGTPVHNSRLFDQGGNAVGGAGAVDQTSTPAREIQFALKLIW